MKRLREKIAARLKNSPGDPFPLWNRSGIL